MVKGLADPSLYEYTGGEALSLEALQSRYAEQTSGQSIVGSERWLNWVFILRGMRAHIHPDHHASMGVARHQALHPTSAQADGETRWES